MERLIDADALLEQIKLTEQSVPYGGPVYYVLDTWEKAKSLVSDSPTVDAAPMAHGRWECHLDASGKKIDDYWYCSKCFGCNEFRRSRYCPNCGAKMDLEETP